MSRKHLMSAPRTARFLAALALACLLAAPHVAAETYYVAPYGSDSRRGSISDPFRTIQRAADVVEPGDTVVLRDGVYTGDEETVAEIRRSGKHDAWITFKADNQWGAIVDGRNFTSMHGIIIARGVGFIRFEGLQVRNVYSGGFSASENTHDLYYYRNLIHRIGLVCTESSGGLVGFRDKDTSSRLTFDSNVLHTIGRDHPSDGCSSILGNYKNHDHGMYLHGKDHRIINNVFSGFRSGWAIQSAEGASGWLIANNTFAFPNPNREGQIVLWRKNRDFTIANNIFYHPNGAAILLNPCDNKSNIIVRNNLSTAEMIHNQATGDGACENIKLLDNMTNTDPAFLNPQQQDFHLTAKSPAVGKADESVTPELDHEGTPRPQGKGYDLGAFEFGRDAANDTTSPSASTAAAVRSQ